MTIPKKEYNKNLLIENASSILTQLPHFQPNVKHKPNTQGKRPFGGKMERGWILSNEKHRNIERNSYVWGKRNPSQNGTKEYL